MTAEELLILEKDIAAKKKQLDEAKRKIRDALALKIGNYFLSIHKEVKTFEEANAILSAPVPEVKSTKKTVKKTESKSNVVPSVAPELDEEINGDFSDAFKDCDDIFSEHVLDSLKQ